MLLLITSRIGHCFQSAKSKVDCSRSTSGGGLPKLQGQADNIIADRMHCLGAGLADQASSPSSGFGSRGGVLSVVRALGVLVCEGRIQGPPRGYKEGPHCVPPLQSAPNNHTCDNENYLCDRYLVLVHEITERVATGSYLSVEVVLCSDCACGMKKSKSKHRVLGTPDKTPWQQHSSEMLLEYWSISVVPSKSPETMNSQGLYQAVRSRLHFSQVAAWWSRTNGAKPNYIATRIVQQQQDDHLRKFRETPVEHTFPLAGIGDGNSIKVTVWALPRMEDIPKLQCSLHLAQTEEPAKQLEHCVRASTPTKPLVPSATLVSSPSSSNTIIDAIADAQQHSHLVMPALLDDRLQIPCDKPGKHHCRCADEEDDDVEEVQPSVSQAQRPNGERKRRRSLPCRPPDSPSSANSNHNGNNAANNSQPQEHSTFCSSSSSYSSSSSSSSSSSFAGMPALKEALLLPPMPATTVNAASDGLDTLERSFRAQLSIDEQQESSEKRYKRSDSIGYLASNTKQQQQHQQPTSNTHVPLLIPWVSYSANGNIVTSVLPLNNQNTGAPHDSRDNASRSSSTTTTVTTNNNVNLVVNPFHTVEQLSCRADHNELDKDKNQDKQDQASILDWITRVPARVLGSTASPPTHPLSTLPKSTHNNLDLSPREFDEVLAVLRARTPLGRRRATVRTAKRREKYDRLVNETQQQQRQQQRPSKSEICTAEIENKADMLLGAILRSSSHDKKNVDTETTEPLETAATSTNKEEAKPRNASPESSDTGNVVDVGASLPASLNKRLLRLKHLFKRYEHEKLIQNKDATESPPRRESRVKRRIDFSNEAVKASGNATHCDSSVGTSTNGNAHVDSILARITNNGRLDQHTAECCAKSADKKAKTRGKRYLSPIWVNHNNNYLDARDKECATTTSEHQSEYPDKTIVPTAKDQERFRRSLENAASMVFHSRTGLPLTSSPAPLRRGSCCFDFDSSLNSVSSKRSALFELNTPPSPGAVSLEEGDREMENACDIEEVTRRRSTSRNRPQSHALLGSFEESALNGRLEPVSTVHGFTAEIGASGSFCPKHRKLPVTVFFYTLGDNDKVSSPYLAHINLGKKGYQIPRSGTIQVTLSNPLGTVVKMFVVLYDLSDMPPRSHTFLRQRTLRDKTLRYLIHLRFMSGKSGRIYLHTDIRMIICRKSDVDTASDFGSEPSKELRSFIHGPTNPKFSPRC